MDINFQSAFQKANGLENPSFQKGSLEDLSKKKEEKKKAVEEEEEDPWNIVAQIDTGPKWSGKEP